MSQIPGNATFTMGYKGLQLEIPLEDLLAIALDGDEWGVDEDAITDAVLHTPELRKAMLKKISQWGSRLTTEEYDQIVSDIGDRYREKRLDELVGLLWDSELTKIKDRHLWESYGTFQALSMNNITIFEEWAEDLEEALENLDSPHVAQVCDRFERIVHQYRKFVEAHASPAERSRFNVYRFEGHGYGETTWEDASGHWRAYIERWLEGGEVPETLPANFEAQIQARVKSVFDDYTHKYGPLYVGEAKSWVDTVILTHNVVDAIFSRPFNPAPLAVEVVRDVQ